ncbi:MAG: glycosyl hydrolase family 25 [Bacteroidaceae bacterium]|nr:glycosyl hydrolase family 25 [Bacteroidaceae bacterium]
MGIIFQPSLHEPDAQMSPLPSAPPLVRQHEVTIRRRHTTGKRGIDVSHYQDHINWDAVAEDHDVSYVYIKATEHAGLVDSKFQVNLREAHRVGIPVGCYHFFSPTAAPLAQLQNMTSAVPDLKKHDLVPMIDVEVKGRRTSAAELRSRLKQFLKGVENYYGIRPIIYTGQNFYNDYLAGYFEDYLFMIAKYSEEMPELNGTPRFAMWQYSASGRVKGIKGAVDRSCFVDNYSLRDILIKKK